MASGTGLANRPPPRSHRPLATPHSPQKHSSHPSPPWWQFRPTPTTLAPTTTCLSFLTLRATRAASDSHLPASSQASSAEKPPRRFYLAHRPVTSKIFNQLPSIYSRYFVTAVPPTMAPAQALDPEVDSELSPQPPLPISPFSDTELTRGLQSTWSRRRKTIRLSA